MTTQKFSMTLPKEVLQALGGVDGARKVLMHATPEGRIIAVAEFYEDATKLERELLFAKLESWILVATVTLIILGLWGYAQRMRPAMGKVRRKLANLTSVIQESLAGILVVKLFGRERFQAEKVGQQSHDYLNANLKTLRITSLWMPYTHVVMGTATALVLWVGGRNVIAGAISLGTLIGFMTYIQMLLRPIRQTGMMLSIIMRSLAAAERVFEVLDTQPGVQDAPDASPLPLIEGYVQFTGVSFSYDGGQ